MTTSTTRLKWNFYLHLKGYDIEMEFLPTSKRLHVCKIQLTLFIVIVMLLFAVDS